jgi:ABC-type multidrug transport system ATPase subunit
VRGSRRPCAARAALGPNHAGSQLSRHAALPPGPHARAALPQALILELGLKDCAATRVGGQRVRGISGGEARRVTTAVQLVTDPALLFCDEPTTGLDAFTTRNLVETFAAVAARGRTVLVTMHQPRADVLALFNATLLLTRGLAAYFGDTSAMMGYFAALGFTCPSRTNPGDFFLDLSSVDTRTPAAEAATRRRVAALLDAWEAHVRAAVPGGAGGAVAEGALARDDAAAAALLKPPAEEEDAAPAAGAAGATLLLADAPRAGAASALEQTAVLFTRGVLNTVRDALTVTGLLTESVVIAVAIGAIFYNLGGSAGDLVSRTSLAYLVGSLQTYQFLVFSIYCLCAELAVYDHEAADGMYGVLPYVAARYAVLLPQMLIFPTLFSIIVYYMSNLRDDAASLGIFIAVMFAVHMIGFSLAFVCVAAQRSFAQASLMANSIYTFFGLVSGLLVQLQSVPIWLGWIKSISFLNFSFRILVATELRGRSWCPDALRAQGAAACEALDGDATLQRLGVKPQVWDAAVALAVNFVVLVALAVAVLALRPRIAARLEAAVAPGRAAEPPAPAPALKDGAQAQAEADAAAADADAEAAAATPDPGSVVVPMAGASPELSFRAFAPVTVTLRDVGLTLRARRRTQPRGQIILQRISLTLRAGTLTGVLGASGSGKSSLLNALAARVRPGEAAVSGAVRFNGAPLRASAARAVVGYVTQHDALLPLLTVFETLHYAARLRLPEGMLPEAKLLRVETVLAELGLRDCAGTMIGLDAGAEGAAAGAAHGRGVSGGEKRRVSIAVQMLTDPAVLLCDEPTSGLDAFTAFNIGATLTRLAEGEGRTVVATLHQPREGLFALLHQVALLAQGRLVYCGAGGEALLAYFEARGHACPPLTNPADFVIDAASVDLRNAAAEADSRARVAALIDAYAAQEDAADADAAAEGPGGGAEDGAADTAGAAAADAPSMARPTGSLHTTAPLLLRRSALNLARQPGVLAARIMQGISFGIILCIFYTRLGTDQRSVQNRIGLLYELMALIFVGMLNCIAVFPTERNVFYRECADGTYGTAAFVLTYSLLEVPCEILAALVFAALVGPIAGLQYAPAQFFRLAYVVFCVVNAGESIGMAFCGLIYHIGFSVTIMSVFLSVWSVMSGFFSIGMPHWLQVVNHASVLKYAGNMLAVNEFQGLRLDGGATGDDVLRLFRFQPQHAARDAWVLFLLVALYRLLAALALDRNKSRHM